MSQEQSHIRKIAVIGAGYSGIVTAGHLLEQGLSVTVFERSEDLGGVWRYDPRMPPDPPFPSDRPILSLAIDKVSEARPASLPTPEQSPRHMKPGPADAKDAALMYAPPGPAYANLKTNVPAAFMRSLLASWPEGTEGLVHRESVEVYIKRLAKVTGAHNTVQLNTRVEDVWKSRADNKWHIRTTKLDRSSTAVSFQSEQYEFDATVVAAGHYDFPRIPNTPGLAEWKRAFPDRVLHSKQYRTSDKFEGQNVLVVGAGVSALDIAKELAGVASRVMRSSRSGLYDIKPANWPLNVELVADVDHYKLLDDEPILAGSVIPGEIHLKDGSVKEDIHYIVLATGYITTYPFLGDLQSATLSPEDAGDELIVTADALITHNLYKDIFYIPDPTLAFVGVPYHVSTFSLYDARAQALARVFSGRADLPDRAQMRAEHSKRSGALGDGKLFHSLLGDNAEVAYMEGLTRLIAEGAAKHGVATPMSPSADWLAALQLFKDKLVLLSKG